MDLVNSCLKIFVPLVFIYASSQVEDQTLAQITGILGFILLILSFLFSGLWLKLVMLLILFLLRSVVDSYIDTFISMFSGQQVKK